MFLKVTQSLTRVFLHVIPTLFLIFPIVICIISVLTGLYYHPNVIFSGNIKKGRTYFSLNWSGLMDTTEAFLNDVEATSELVSFYYDG